VKDPNLAGLCEGATPAFTKSFKWATRLEFISPSFFPPEDEDRPSFQNVMLKKSGQWLRP
jgi:hypothetical protein